MDTLKALKQCENNNPILSNQESGLVIEIFKCKKCEKLKPSTEFRFRVRKNRKDIFIKTCKKCECEISKENYHNKKNNPDFIKKRRKYENSEKRKKSCKKRNREYYHRNPEKHKQASNEYRINNKDKIHERDKREWQKNKMNKFIESLTKSNVIEELGKLNILEDVCFKANIPSKYLIKYGVNYDQFIRLKTYIKC